MSELVLYEARGAIAVLTFNRPEKLNALNYALVDRVMQRLDAIEDDGSVQAVVLADKARRYAIIASP